MVWISADTKNTAIQKKSAAPFSQIFPVKRLADNCRTIRKSKGFRKQKYQIGLFRSIFINI
ncbi:hypothetical protein C7N83_04120 [Neisseria iguanae]|uniref:Uncharacterized protein n=1 Tax=Neisseria iguanae TaxID=90242 RepID=A0A2P7U1N6_9NEIS|nr:hypothetical protein C7N83_04120 [Neisseria iguanae]